MKYRNKPCVVGTEKYRSQRERNRHQALLLLQKAGHIAGLTREVPFDLVPGVKFTGAKRATPALRYWADFVYTDVKAGRVIVEDCKGVKTTAYKLKRHMMLALRGIEVKES